MLFFPIDGGHPPIQLFPSSKRTPRPARPPAQDLCFFESAFSPFLPLVKWGAPSRDGESGNGFSFPYSPPQGHVPFVFLFFSFSWKSLLTASFLMGPASDPTLPRGNESFCGTEAGPRLLSSPCRDVLVPGLFSPRVKNLALSRKGPPDASPVFFLSLFH